MKKLSVRDKALAAVIHAHGDWISVAQISADYECAGYFVSRTEMPTQLQRLRQAGLIVRKSGRYAAATENGRPRVSVTRRVSGAICEILSDGRDRKSAEIKARLRKYRPSIVATSSFLSSVLMRLVEEGRVTKISHGWWRKK